MHGTNSIRMNINTSRYLSLIVTLLFVFKGGCSPVEDGPSYDPLAIYLTWQYNPSTTMTIDWHDTLTSRNHILEYRKPGQRRWNQQSPAEIDFPFSERIIYRSTVTGLAPDSEYEFRFGPNSVVYRFRTMPATASRPIQVAVGGDSMHRKHWMEQVAREAMKFDLDFVIIGGDMAYEDGLPPERQRHRDENLTPGVNLMYHWFDAYKNTFVTEEGRVIPMIVTIGNHEVNGSYWFNDHERPELPPYAQTDEVRALHAPYFYAAFAMPGQPGYNVLDFGDYLSLILLDTDHSNPVEGIQTEWLEQQLQSRTHIPHVIPVYHVPAWPSVRSMYGRVQTNVRTHWVPLFEQYNVELAFENHDHAYKRTHPIRDGRIAEDGIVYVGDGAWGTGTREIGSRQEHDAWYLARGAAERHFILLTIDGMDRSMVMINEDGVEIDRYPE